MSSHLGTTNFLETPTVGGLPVLLNGGGVVSVAAGSVLPAANTPGRLFFNTAQNIIYRDTGSAWVRESSPVLQFATGLITPSSGNVALPYDNTLPGFNEGNLGWSASFTPRLATSNIVITTSSFIVSGSTADTTYSGVMFSGTTAIGAQLLAWQTNPGIGANFCMVNSEVAGSTNARTYTFKYGGSGSVTAYLAQGSSGQSYGAANTGRWTIVEIAA